MYTYKLLGGDSEIISCKLPVDRSAILLKYLDTEIEMSGTFRVVVWKGDDEIFVLSRVTKKEGILLIESIREDEVVPVENRKELSKARKISIKLFVGFFMLFAILSFIVKLRDYSKLGGRINIFNSLVTLVLIGFLCFGIYLFFFGKKKSKEAEN
jgi:hypothetical protein